MAQFTVLARLCLHPLGQFGRNVTRAGLLCSAPATRLANFKEKFVHHLAHDAPSCLGVGASGKLGGPVVAQAVAKMMVNHGPRLRRGRFFQQSGRVVLAFFRTKVVPTQYGPGCIGHRNLLYHLIFLATVPRGHLTRCLIRSAGTKVA